MITNNLGHSARANEIAYEIRNIMNGRMEKQAQISSLRVQAYRLMNLCDDMEVSR